MATEDEVPPSMRAVLLLPGLDVGESVELFVAPGFLACDGIKVAFKDGLIASSFGLKLNNGGSSLPFGSLVLASLSSAKKLCAHASTGESLLDGVYSRSLLHSNVASGGTRGRNTLLQG